MIGGFSAAGLFGGLGLFLVGSRWVRSGLTEYAERFSADLAFRTGTPVKAALAGASLAAPLFGSGELPSAAARLGRARGLHSERVAMLSIGSSFGPVMAGALAVLASMGWTVATLAVVALLAGAVLPLARSDWERRGEAMAGWGMLLLAIAAMGFGWAELGRAMAGDLGAKGPTGVILLAVAGATAAALLRSPALVACAALQATAAGVLHVGSGVAVLAGAVLASSAGLADWIRGGSLEERAIGFGHLVFSLLWCAVLLAVLASLSNVVGYLAQVPGGAGVSLLLLLALGGAGSAALAHALLGPTEQLVRARLEPSETRGALDWGGAPEILASELGRALGEAAESTRDLARGALGHGSSGHRRKAQAFAELEHTLAAIDSLREERSTERLPLSLGCALHAARGCAEALRIVAVHLGDHRATASLGDRPLDLRAGKCRLGVMKLVESSRPEDPAFTLERWSNQVIDAQTAMAQLWSQAASACGAGTLHPLHLVDLKEELDTLGSIVREIDRAVSEWATLVPGVLWGEPPTEAPPDERRRSHDSLVAEAVSSRV